jgi:hypothetical protein
MAVPVAALNLVPAVAATNGSYPAFANMPASGSIAAASTGSAVAPPASNKFNIVAPPQQFAAGQSAIRSTNGSAILTNQGQTVLRSSDGSTITIAAPDSEGRRRTILHNANGSVLAFADASAVPGLAVALGTPPAAAPASNSAVDRAVAMKEVGVTPDYAASIRAAAPQLRFSDEDLVELKGAGVTATFIQGLARLGYRNVSVEDITGAYAMGIREDYVRGLASAGYGPLPLRELIELKAVGITPADVERFRRAGYGHLDPDKLVQLKTLGITPEELKASERSGP